MITTPLTQLLDVEGALSDLFARGVDTVLYSTDTMVFRAVAHDIRERFRKVGQTQERRWDELVGAGSSGAKARER